MVIYVPLLGIHDSQSNTNKVVNNDTKYLQYYRRIKAQPYRKREKSVTCFACIVSISITVQWKHEV